ncbi:MAG: glycosyltransferase, partial [Bdellovibrionales bacterium]|nr:glycosyltransferase [Bdellovibrionales bacterium]
DSKTWVSAPNNRHGFVMRLFFDILCGLELFLRIFFSRAEIVFLSSPPFITTLIGSWAALIRRKFLVFDIRDPYPDVFVEHNVVSASNPIYRVLLWLTHWTYRRASLNITVTDGFYNTFQGYGVNNFKIYRNGYNEEMFSAGHEKHKTFTAVSHGNLGAFQNIDLLLKVAEEVYNRDPEIKFVVAGSGVQAHKLEKSTLKNLDYLGQVDYANIPEIVGAAHVGLSFRTDGDLGKTAFPIRIYEFIASGLAVVNTPLNESGDLLEAEGAGRQFKSEQVQAIVDYILELKKETPKFDPQKFEKFSRGRIAREFTKDLETLTSH